MTQNSDIALVEHTCRQEGEKPGSRGPHLNLFSGGTVAKKAAVPVQSVSERVASFAKTHRFKDETRRVLEAVVEHRERTGQPLQLDGFDLARKAGIRADGLTFATSFIAKLDPALGAVLAASPEVSAALEAAVLAQIEANGPDAPFILPTKQ